MHSPLSHYKHSCGVPVTWNPPDQSGCTVSLISGVLKVWCCHISNLPCPRNYKYLHFESSSTACCGVLGGEQRQLLKLEICAVAWEKCLKTQLNTIFFPQNAALCGKWGRSLEFLNNEGNNVFWNLCFKKLSSLVVPQNAFLWDLNWWTYLW